MFVVTERFLLDLVNICGNHPTVSTDGGTWYPKQAYRFLILQLQLQLQLQHHLYFAYEKSLIERTIQYIKDRTDSFDDYFLCKRKKCKLKHVKNWLKLFVDYHNTEIRLK